MKLRVTDKDTDDIVLTIPDREIAKVFASLDVVTEARTMFKSMARAMRAADNHMHHRLTVEEIQGARKVVAIYNKAYNGRFGYTSQEQMSYADQALLGLRNYAEARPKMVPASECCGCYTTIARDASPYLDDKVPGPSKSKLFLVQVCLHCKRRIEWINFDDHLAATDNTGDYKTILEGYKTYPTYDVVASDDYKGLEALKKCT